MEEIIKYKKSKFISCSHFLIITSISYSLESLDAFIKIGNNSRKDRNESKLDEINDQTVGVDFLFGDLIHCEILDGKISLDSVECSIS